MTTGAALVKGASRRHVARQAGAVTTSAHDRNLEPAADDGENAPDESGNALDGGEFTVEMDDGEREADDRSGATDGTPESAG